MAKDTKKDVKSANDEVKKNYVRHPVANLPEGQEGVDFYIATTRYNSADNMTVHTYEVAWPVPKTDEEAQARYGTTIAGMVIKGVQETSHGPKYKDLEVNDAGELLDPAGPQTLADAYKPGEKKVSETKLMKNLLEVAKGKGKSMAEIEAMIAAM